MRRFPLPYSLSLKSGSFRRTYEHTDRVSSLLGFVYLMVKANWTTPISLPNGIVENPMWKCSYSTAGIDHRHNLGFKPFTVGASVGKP